MTDALCKMTGCVAPAVALEGTTLPTLKPYYEAEGVTLYHGDCREVMAELPECSVDAIVTPPGGVICDPFLGSGSTGMAALDEGFRFVGIDLEAHYLDIASRRIARRHLIEPLPPRESGQGALL